MAMSGAAALARTRAAFAAERRAREERRYRFSGSLRSLYGLVEVDSIASDPSMINHDSGAVPMGRGEITSKGVKVDERLAAVAETVVRIPTMRGITREDPELYKLRAERDSAAKKLAAYREEFAREMRRVNWDAQDHGEQPKHLAARRELREKLERLERKANLTRTTCLQAEALRTRVRKGPDKVYRVIEPEDKGSILPGNPYVHQGKGRLPGLDVPMVEASDVDTINGEPAINVPAKEARRAFFDAGKQGFSGDDAGWKRTHKQKGDTRRYEGATTYLRERAGE